MCKRYQQLLAILSYIHILNAITIYVTPSLSSPSSSAAAAAAASSSSSTSTSSSVKPSTLLLPSGFDSQLPPRQPMLYPFVVSSAQPTPPTRKPIGPFITPGWIPMSSSNANELPFASSSSTSTTTSTPQPYPAAVPMLEDRISKYVLKSTDNGPVFESIIYGTWKPDPPLQPVEIVNATTTQYSSGSVSVSDGVSIGYAFAGQLANKTINRQHGGFIDNKQQNVIKFAKDSHEKSSSVEHISNESIDNIEQKTHTATKFVKKQGRQKIRPNSTSPTSAMTTASTTSTTTTAVGTTASHEFPFTVESTEQSATERDVIKVNIDAPVEVVSQINDSIEIKYNHKQTSRHSIEMTKHERYDNRRHEHHPDDDDEDDGEVEQQTKKLLTTATELQHQQQQEEDEYDEDDELGNSSVIRMNWPTDFMDIPLSPSSTVQSADDNASSQLTTRPGMESAESTELPLALSALNIPPSLWPKLPGNITKLGNPYAAESSLEEPAICVPITVREFNMMNSNEVVNIERVFCFPMPSDTNTARENFKSTSSSTRNTGHRNRGRSTVSPIIKANIQNYEEYFETHSQNTSCVVTSQLYLLCYVVVFYFKIIY